MLCRREFLVTTASTLLAPAALASLARRPHRGRALRFAVVADLHHGPAPDALERLGAFADAVRGRPDLDFVLQMGDFCHAGREPGPCLEIWNGLDLPRLHVLGNHDMDTCTKERAMEAWGMPSRYGASEFGGWRFLTLDLNHIREGDDRKPYESGSFYVDGAKRAWADLEQLDWLRTVLEDPIPTVILSHQPLGLVGPGEAVPPQQREVLDLLAPDGRPRPGVAACISGHLHVDRWERFADVPCWCVNSASYFWFDGMVPYRRPLFAFVTLDPAGVLSVEGVVGEWAQAPDVRPVLPTQPWISPSIGDRSETIASDPKRTLRP